MSKVVQGIVGAAEIVGGALLEGVPGFQFAGQWLIGMGVSTELGIAPSRIFAIAHAPDRPPEFKAEE